jgi:hypothetical protein
MNVQDVVASVQFVVDPEGKPTGALLSMDTWNTIIQVLEEVEDRDLVRAYIKRRRNASSPEDMGLLSWDEVQTSVAPGELARDLCY